MGGFLPLIEAFAAFALTMVALTTAVGAILGIMQRTLRMRAQGLRQLLVYFFRNEVKPRLAVLGESKPDLPWRNLEDALPQFLVDMTFLPTVHPVSADGSDTRLITAKMSIDGNLLQRWQSWNYGIDSLNDNEFTTRIKASQIYGILAVRMSADQLAATLGEMAARFQAYARAATESFSRTARIGTVILGLLLAFGLNIDSFALLGRYMTDPRLTSDILVKQAEALKSQSASGSSPSVGAIPGGDIDPQVKALQTKLDVLTRAIADAGSAASTSEITAVRQAAQDAQAALKPVQEDLQATSEGTGVFGASTALVRAELADLSRSFPIGWSLYPGCAGPTLDTRCLSIQYNPDIPSSIGARLAWIARNDTGDFLRWLGGTLILGILLGLGTPFWVEVSNNFLRARELIADPTPGAPAANQPTPSLSDNAAAAAAAATAAPLSPGSPPPSVSG